MRLSRSDLEGALGFLGEAGALEGVDPLTTELLNRLSKLVRCQGVSYCETDRRNGKLTFYADTTGEPSSGAAQEAYLATVHEHPIRCYRTRTGALGAFKIYDFVTKRQLRRTAFYNDYLRPFNPPAASGFVMTLSLRAAIGHTRTLLLDREAEDFGERERTLLNLLQPHLEQQRRATEVRRQARAVSTAPNDGVLTERESEVLLHVAQGMRNHEIARALWIAPGTVRKHLNNIYAKLGVHSRGAATAQLYRDRNGA